jgi:hypothetical protein
MSRGPEPAGRSGIGSSNSRFQPRSVTGLDRLPQPLHGEFDILRLQAAPALDFGLVPLFGKRWKYSAANFLAAVRSRVNFRG